MTSDLYVTRPFLPPLEEFTKRVEGVWDRAWLTNAGPLHNELEARLCEYLGVEHISLFANGTLALIVALRALGVCGEVITTPYSFVATAHAITWAGLTPVFADIDPVSGNLDPRSVEAAATEHTCAILPVHCYGHPCDVEGIGAVADRLGVPVLYDAAHAFAVRLGGESVLRHGACSALSFHATKVFNTFEGGAVVSSSAEMKAKIDELKNFGITDEVTVVAAGMNAKMNEISAAMGLTQLDHIEEALGGRHAADAQYRDGLQEVKGIDVLPVGTGVDHNAAYFPILVRNSFPLGRDELYDALKAQGIFGRRYFFPLITSFPMYCEQPSAAPANLPVASRFACQVLCLPICAGLEPASVSRVVEAIRGAG